MRHFIFALLLSGCPVLGQGIKEEQITYGTTLNKPIQIEVVRSNNKIEFVCTNISFYPYEVELQFNTLENLRPFVMSFKQVVNNGRTKLLEFTIVESSRPHNYGYKVRYIRGNPKLTSIDDYPYLLPLKEGDTVKLASKWSNQLMLNVKDTICAIRKGTVTALPNSNYETDRVTFNSLEVLHEDGSIAVYQLLNPEKIFVNLGQTVIPGQAIGEVGEQATLMFTIYKPFGTGRLQSLRALFFTETKNQPLSELDGQVVHHSVNIVTKEFNKRELNRYIRQTEKKLQRPKP